MPASEPRSEPAATFDVRTAIELARHGLFDRIAFAAVYAVLSLSVLPWMQSITWIAVIALWELGLGPVLDRAVQIGRAHV